MKTFAILTLTIVLTAAMLVGCGCTNQNKGETSAPTVLPTNEEIWDTTEATTRATTESTMNTQPSATFDQGNGPLEDSTNTTGGTNSTEETGGGNAQGNSRSGMGGTGRMGGTGGMGGTGSSGGTGGMQ